MCTAAPSALSVNSNISFHPKEGSVFYEKIPVVQVKLSSSRGVVTYVEEMRKESVYNSNFGDGFKDGGKASWAVEKTLNDAAEYMYQRTKRTKRMPRRRKGRKYRIWKELKAKLEDEVYAGNGAVVYSDADDRELWMFCALISPWKSRIARMRSILAPIMHCHGCKLRVCCAFYLINGMDDLKRSPKPYLDYIPKKKIKEMVDQHNEVKEAMKRKEVISLYKIYSLVGGSTTWVTNSKDNPTDGGTTFSTGNKNVKTIFIDLFGDSQDSIENNGYSEDCKL